MSCHNVLKTTNRYHKLDFVKEKNHTALVSLAMLKNAELVSARRFAGVSYSRRAPWSNTNTLSQYDMTFSMLCETMRRVELRKRRENDVSIRSSNLVLKVDVDSSKTTHLDSSARGKHIQCLSNQVRFQSHIHF